MKIIFLILFIGASFNNVQPERLWVCGSVQIGVDGNNYWQVRVVAAKNKKEAEKIFDKTIKSSKFSNKISVIKKDNDSYSVYEITDKEVIRK